MIKKTWQEQKCIRKMDFRKFLQKIKRRVIEENNQIDGQQKRKKIIDDDSNKDVISTKLISAAT